MRIVGSPQCPKCYRDILPSNLSVEHEYEEYSLGPVCERYATRVTRTHACKHIIPNNLEIRWVTEK